MELFANETDMPDIYNNWEDSFGDTKEEIAAFFTALKEEVQVCVVRKEGVVAAQLCLLPISVGGKEAMYLYAVATNKAYRKKGLCTLLLKKVARWLESQNKCGILVPADISLQAFYHKRGFRHCFIEQRVLIQGKPADTLRIETCTVSRYIMLRKQAFLGKNCVEVSDRMLRYALEGYLQSGYQLGTCLWQEREFGVLYRETDKLFIQEITVFDEEEAKEATEVFVAGRGKREAWLQRSYPTMATGLPEEICKNGYFNLVLD